MPQTSPPNPLSEAERGDRNRASLPLSASERGPGGEVSSVKVAILGGSGYTAVELMKLLLRHPHAEIVAVTSRQEPGKPVSADHPILFGRLDLPMENFDADKLKAKGVECVFGCLPHGASAEAVAPLLERGMRVELPDPMLSSAIEVARADVLLASRLHRPPGEVVAALEDWGFDADAEAAWHVLSGRQRRHARTRPDRPARWDEVQLLAERGDAASLLIAVRALLAYEAPSASGVAPTISLLNDVPAGWRGQPIELHAVPTRHGALSCAVRWHGPRPALLWDAPGGVRLVAPGLDPSWSTEQPSGEVLLAAPS